MRLRTIEISVGAFVLAGILAAIFVAVRISGINVVTDEGSYAVTARFKDIAGLNRRAKVTMAGVTIGRVTEIEVDPEYAKAVVTMQIDGNVTNLPVDTQAMILTEGLIGGRYIGLEPGIEDEVIVDGGTIMDTQSAMVLEKFISEFATRAGGS